MTDLIKCDDCGTEDNGGASELRWSDEVDAVVNEDGTIVYAVSSEVGNMIIGYHRQKEVIANKRREINAATCLIEQADQEIVKLRAQLAAVLATHA